MWIWDYKINKNWKPRTGEDWKWFLVRKINFGDFKGIKKETLRKYFPGIKKWLDLGKRQMIENFLRKWN